MTVLAVKKTGGPRSALGVMNCEGRVALFGGVFSAGRATSRVFSRSGHAGTTTLERVVFQVVCTTLGRGRVSVRGRDVRRGRVAFQVFRNQIGEVRRGAGGRSSSGMIRCYRALQPIQARHLSAATVYASIVTCCGA